MGTRAPIVWIGFATLAAFGAEVWSRGAVTPVAQYVLARQIVQYDSNETSVVSLPIANLSGFPVHVKQAPSCGCLMLLKPITIKGGSQGTLAVQVTPSRSVAKSERLELVVEPGGQRGFVEFRFGVPVGGLRNIEGDKK